MDFAFNSYWKNITDSLHVFQQAVFYHFFLGHKYIDPAGPDLGQEVYLQFGTCIARLEVEDVR
jgi:hypothetical protein